MVGEGYGTGIKAYATETRQVSRRQSSRDGEREQGERKQRRVHRLDQTSASRQGARRCSRERVNGRIGRTALVDMEADTGVVRGGWSGVGVGGRDGQWAHAQTNSQRWWTGRNARQGLTYRMKLSLMTETRLRRIVVS